MAAVWATQSWSLKEQRHLHSDGVWLYRVIFVDCPAQVALGVCDP